MVYIQAIVTVVVDCRPALYMKTPIESLRTMIFHYEWAHYSDPIIALDNYLFHNICNDDCWKLLPRQVLTYRLAQLLCLRGRYTDAMGWLAVSVTDKQLPGWDNMVYLTSYYLDEIVVAPPMAPIPCDNVHMAWRMYWLGRQGTWDYRQVWPEGLVLLGD